MSRKDIPRASMPNSNTAELLVRCLENEGVKYIFGVPGEEILDLLDALSRSESIRLVTTRHEQGAAFMADVYGRLSTYPGVCMATLEPGATNLITGIADAQSCHPTRTEHQASARRNPTSRKTRRLRVDRGGR